MAVTVAESRGMSRLGVCDSLDGARKLFFDSVDGYASSSLGWRLVADGEIATEGGCWLDDT